MIVLTSTTVTTLTADGMGTVAKKTTEVALKKVPKLVYVAALVGGFKVGSIVREKTGK